MYENHHFLIIKTIANNDHHHVSAPYLYNHNVIQKFIVVNYAYQYNVLVNIKVTLMIYILYNDICRIFSLNAIRELNNIFPGITCSISMCLVYMIPFSIPLTVDNFACLKYTISREQYLRVDILIIVILLC